LKLLLVESEKGSTEFQIAAISRANLMDDEKMIGLIEKLHGEFLQRVKKLSAH
jgi:predicted ATPase